MGTTAQAGCFYLPSCPVKRWFSRSVPLARATTYGEARTDEPKTIILCFRKRMSQGWS
jgi:hypothetical protein